MTSPSGISALSCSSVLRANCSSSDSGFGAGGGGGAGAGAGGGGGGGAGAAGGSGGGGGGGGTFLLHADTVSTTSNMSAVNHTHRRNFIGTFSCDDLLPGISRVEISVRSIRCQSRRAGIDTDLEEPQAELARIRRALDFAGQVDPIRLDRYRSASFPDRVGRHVHRPLEVVPGTELANDPVAGSDTYCRHIGEIL